jgi:hypothetical protein
MTLARCPQHKETDRQGTRCPCRLRVLPASRAASRRFPASTLRKRVRLGAIVLIHIAALATLFATEFELFHLALGVLTWIGLNLLFLSILRRPLMAAVLSLSLILGLIGLSLFKFEVTWLTLTFLDVLIVDSGTVRFLLKTFPNFRLGVLAGFIAAIPLAILIWRVDPFPHQAHLRRARRHRLPRADRRDVAQGSGECPGSRSRASTTSRASCARVFPRYRSSRRSAGSRRTRRCRNN